MNESSFVRRLHADTYPADKDAKTQQPGELTKMGSRDPGGGSMMLLVGEWGRCHVGMEIGGGAAGR
jgi:hypothetical protein